MSIETPDKDISLLREALEFYADPFKAKDEYGDPVSIPDFYNELDFGERARAALSATAGKP